jgi:hypothetical protein
MIFGRYPAVEREPREEDGLAELAQPGDHLPGRPAGRRVESGGGFVNEDELGVADQRAQIMTLGRGLGDCSKQAAVSQDLAERVHLGAWSGLPTSAHARRAAQPGDGQPRREAARIAPVPQPSSSSDLAPGRCLLTWDWICAISSARSPVIRSQNLARPV